MTTIDRRGDARYRSGSGDGVSADSDYDTLVTRITIVPTGEPLYHHRAWSVEIEDNSGGEYLVVRALGDDPQEIRIDPSEWPALRAAIDSMAGRCRG